MGRVIVPISQRMVTGLSWGLLAMGRGLATLAFVLSLTTVVAADTLPPLRDEAHVTRSLMAAQVGDVIRNTCPSISARMMVAFEKAKQLERYALNKGYSPEQIKAFLKDKAEKARIKGLAADYIAKNGGKAGDVQSYCALGRNEIAKQSLIGSLLRAEG